MENKFLYGFINCAYHNRNPDGDTHFYTSKARRDAELKEFREAAIKDGLSRDAAQTGIYVYKIILKEAVECEDEFRNVISQPVMVDCAEVGEQPLMEELLSFM